MAKYKKDYLDNVIVRLDFDTTLPFSKKNPPTAIYNAIKERFPITEEKKIIGKEFLVGPKGSAQKDIESLEWYYYGVDRNKNLKVTPEFLVIEYRKYEYYEQLKEDFIAVANELFDNFSKIKAKRLGFRYIDSIKLKEDNPTEWDNYINPVLNSNLAIVDDRKTLSRVFHVTEYNYGNSNLRFQYGMLNPDFPAPIKKKIYTLDFDMYTNNILEKSELAETLDQFHKKLTQSFEEVITDNLRKVMEVVDE